MKLETLLKRYKAIGYKFPGSMSKDLEVTKLKQWLWNKHKIQVKAFYHDMNITVLKPNPYKKFRGIYRFDCGKVNSNQFQCDRTFKNPFDAEFDALVTLLPGLKFKLGKF